MKQLEFVKRPLMTFGSIIVFLALVVPKVPNVFCISDVSRAAELLSVIAQILGSIFGIVIAIVILAFELLRKNYSVGLAIEELFNNLKLKELFYFFAVTIILSLFVLSSFSGTSLTDKNIVFVYACLLLFILALLFLLRYLKEILSASRYDSAIKKIVDKISDNGIDSADVVNPFKDLARSIINSVDLNAAGIVFDNSLQAFKNYLDKTSTNQDQYRRAKLIDKFFDEFVEESFKVASDNKNEEILIILLRAIERFYNACIESQYRSYELNDINSLLRKILSTSIESRLDETFGEGCWMIERIFEKSIALMERGIPVANDNQWEHVANDYIAMLSSAGNKVIDLESKDLLDDPIRSLLRCAEVVNNSKTLGDLQKEYISHKCYEYVEELTIRAAKKKLKGEYVYDVPFYHLEIERLIINKIPYAPSLLSRFCETIYRLIELGLLDVDPNWSIMGALNGLGSMGRGLVASLEKGMITESVVFIINVFDSIRKIAEKETELTDQSKRIYNEAYSQMKLVNDWTWKEENAKLREHIVTLLEKFDKVDKFKKELESRIERIDWPEGF